MRIGTVSRRTGVSVRMLRYYEEQGVLRPARRASGYRDYAEAEVRLVMQIRRLSEAGLPLATIKTVLPCVDATGDRFQPCAQVRPALEREIAKITGRIAALAHSKAMLSAYLAGTESAEMLAPGAPLTPPPAAPSASHRGRR